MKLNANLSANSSIILNWSQNNEISISNYTLQVAVNNGPFNVVPGSVNYFLNSIFADILSIYPQDLSQFNSITSTDITSCVNNTFLSNNYRIYYFNGTNCYFSSTIKPFHYSNDENTNAGIFSSNLIKKIIFY